MIMKKLALLCCLLLAVSAQSAVKEDPKTQAYYHFLLGNLKEQSHNYTEALEEYKLALKFDPDSSDIFSRMGSLYVQTNRTEEAIREAEKAIEKNPDNKEAHRMLGQIYLEKLYGTEP